MSHPVLRRALAVAGTVAGVAGAAYAAERMVVAALRRRPDPDAGSSLEVVYDEARRIPSHDGGNLFTVSRGDPHSPAIVFAHGLMLSVRLWVKQFDALPDEGFRTVAFDQRGHGESESGEHGYSVDAWAWDLRTLLEHLDLRDVVLVGHSMGGIGVQAFVTRHPDVVRERVRGIVLMSTFARASVAALPWVQYGYERLADHGPELASLMARKNLGLFLTRLGFGRDPQPSHVELNRQLLAECAREAARHSTTAILATDLTGALSSVGAPTLVLHGSADLLVPPGEARALAEQIPDARLEIFGGAGHMLMLERADEVNAVIAEFARDVGARAPRRRWWTRRPRRPRRTARAPGTARPDAERVAS